MIGVEVKLELINEHHALLKRLPTHHFKVDDIRKELHNIESGTRGEDRLLRKLSELYLSKEFHILSDVRLQLNNWRVQIDCLVLTDRGCIILESKNISDNLYFEDNTEEFYKVDKEGREISYPNPYYQLMKHIRFLKELLKSKYPEMKITGAVVLTAKNCRIRSKPAHYPIYKLESIIERIVHLYNQPSSLQLTNHQFKSLVHMIKTKQTSFNFPPLCEYYRIPPTDLIRGVECESCGKLGMKRIGKTWTCPFCQQNSRTAHRQAVSEYFWLVNKEMRNKDFRQFCQVDSVYVASRILSKMELQIHRAGSRTFYTQKDRL